MTTALPVLMIVPCAAHHVPPIHAHSTVTRRDSIEKPDAAQHRVARLLGQPQDARRRRRPTRLPRHFLTLPRMKTVSTWLGFMRLTTALGALLSGQTLMRSARSMTMSASLPGVSVPTLLSRSAQRAPCDGGEFEHVAAGEQRRQVLLAVAPALQDEQALEIEDRPHHAEHVLPDGRRVIGAQRRAQAVVERLLDRRHAVAPSPFRAAASARYGRRCP